MPNVCCRWETCCWLAVCWKWERVGWAAAMYARAHICACTYMRRHCRIHRQLQARAVQMDWLVQMQAHATSAGCTAPTPCWCCFCCCLTTALLHHTLPPGRCCTPWLLFAYPAAAPPCTASHPASPPGCQHPGRHPGRPRLVMWCSAAHQRGAACTARAVECAAAARGGGWCGRVRGCGRRRRGR